VLSIVCIVRAYGQEHDDDDDDHQQHRQHHRQHAEDDPYKWPMPRIRGDGGHDYLIQVISII